MSLLEGAYPKRNDFLSQSDSRKLFLLLGLLDLCDTLIEYHKNSSCEQLLDTKDPSCIN